MASRQAAGVLAVLALALGGAACGDSDDDGSDASANQGAKTTETVAASTPEGKIRAVYATHIKATYANDAKTVCGTLSVSALKSLKEAGGCPAWFKTTIGGGTLSPNRPFIVKLDVKGDRAQALAKTKNSQRYPVYFVKEGGEWKIAEDK